MNHLENFFTHPTTCAILKYIAIVILGVETALTLFVIGVRFP